MKGDRAASEGAAAKRERGGRGGGRHILFSFSKDGRDGQSAPL